MKQGTLAFFYDEDGLVGGMLYWGIDDKPLVSTTSPFENKKCNWEATAEYFWVFKVLQNKPYTIRFFKDSKLAKMWYEVEAKIEGIGQYPINEAVPRDIKMRGTIISMYKERV